MTYDHAEYMRKWRAARPDLAAKARLAKSAHGKALVRLGRRHRTERDALVDEERAKVGLPPVGTESNAPKSRRSA